MISIEHISAAYHGSDSAVSDASLEVASGQFVGFVGPNGSGKTTLLRVISGVLKPKTGRVTIDGVPVRSMGKKKLARILACLPQDIAMSFSFTVREITLMGRSPHLTGMHVETRADFEIISQAMEMADVSHLADRMITELSGGERQRAFMAMCLAQEPKILLLDEPTTHLDIAHQLSMLNLIRRLNLDEKMTVIAVFHDLSLAAEYCDRIVAMDAGKIQTIGTPADVLTAPLIEQLYGAKVIVQTNPISGKPLVVLSAERS